MTGSRERGAALFVAMLVLLMLTVLGGSALMMSNQDIKMAGAAALFYEAEATVEGQLEYVLSQTSSTTLAQVTGTTSASGLSSLANANVTLQFRYESTCSRSFAAFDTSSLPQCSYLDVVAEHGLGRGNTSTTTMTAGIEQPLLVP